MNLKQLESFVLVAQEKNFTKAAKILFMTQPAISFQIKSLEEHLGAPLFVRLDKTVELTEVGEILYPEAKKILASHERVIEAVAELQGIKKGKLLLGASTIPGEYIMPGIIGRFKAQYPEVDVVLKIRSTAEVVDMLQERQINLGVVGAMVKHSNVNCSVLAEDELILVANAQHPLTKLELVNLKDITRYKFILRERGSGTRMVVEEKLLAEGIQPDELQVAMDLGTTRSIITAVETGLGISFVSRWAAQASLQLGTLKEIPIHNFELRRSLYLITNQLRYKGYTTQAFLDFLENLRD